MRTAVQTALDRALKTFAATNGYTIAWPRFPFSPPRDAPWLKASMLPGEREPVSIGSARQERQVGIYQVDVCYPVAGGTNWGPGPPNAVVDRLMHAMRGGQSWVEEDPDARSVSVEISRVYDGTMTEDPDCHRIPVSIVWWAQKLVS